MPTTARSPLPPPENPDITFARIEEGQIEELLQNIQAILDENEGHNAEAFSPALWRWHYRDLPSGKAYVYGAYDPEGKMIGYFHVVVYHALVNGEPKNFSTIQDVAISPSRRRKGAYAGIVNFAARDLLDLDVDLQYAFPNNRSFPTMVKYDAFEGIADLPTYVTPISTSKLIRSKINLFGIERAVGFLADAAVRAFGKGLAADEEVRRHDGVDASMVEVFAEFQEQHTIALVRDHDFLHWRFVQNPNPNHVFVTLSREGKPQAAAILKVDQMFGNPGLLLMDFAHRRGEERSLLKLLSEVRVHPERYVDLEVRFMLTMGLGKFFGELYKVGFLRIPTFANPRVLKIIVKNLRLEDREMPRQPENWHVTLSDWDVL